MRNIYIKTSAAAALISLLLLFSSGCWDTRELNTLAIITGIAIDKTEKPGEIELTAQLGKAAQKSQSGSSGGGGSGEEKPFVMFEAKAEGILSALGKINAKNSREAYYHHNQVVVFGKELSEQDSIEPFADPLLRNHEMRLDEWIIIADGMAKNLISENIQSEKIPTIALSQLMQSLSKSSQHAARNLKTLASMIKDKASGITVPVVGLETVDDMTNYKLMGQGILKKGKLISMLGEKESFGYYWIMADIKQRLIEVTIPEGFCDLFLDNFKGKTEFTIEGQSVACKLSLEMEFGIREIHGFEGKNITETIDLLNIGLKETIISEITECFKKTKELKTDIYSFGQKIFRNRPDKWKDIKDNWDEVFSAMILSPEINSKIVNAGKIDNSLNMKEGYN